MRRSSPTGTSEIDRGLIRLYVLHCAAVGPVTRSSILEQLAHRRQKLDPASVFRILRGLEAKGYVTCAGVPAKYRATRRGRTAIRLAGRSLRALAQSR